MSDFACCFVGTSILMGALTLVAGVALGAVSFPFALAATFCFTIASCVLWDHARHA